MVVSVHKCRSYSPAILFLTLWAPALVLSGEALPDRFPIAMSFGPFLNVSDAGFESRAAEIRPYVWIHQNGGEKLDPIVARAKKMFPQKVFTIQAAYGGVPIGSKVWPGHLLYKAGTLITKSVSERDTVINVEKVERIARNQDMLTRVSQEVPLDATIYALDKNGFPSWDSAEHLIVTRIGPGKLTVKRGQFGSRPRAFETGRAVVATHMRFWTRGWQLNVSLDCPRGGPGNLTAGEWFAREVAKRVTATGADGIEFDVARWTWGMPMANPMDINNDRIADWGYLSGVNSFGLGQQIFFGELRRILGPNRFIQADSNDAIGGARGWKYLNGVQMEAFPSENDYSLFSEAFNHLRLWSENADQTPRASYPYTRAPTTVFEGDRLANGSRTDFRFRVGLAAACMVGMPHPFRSVGGLGFDSDDPVNVPLARAMRRDGVFYWDEYRGGNIGEGWLGRPVGLARQDLSGLDGRDLVSDKKWVWALDAGFKAHAVAGHEYTADVTEIPRNIFPSKARSGVRLELKGNNFALTKGKEYTIQFDARGDDRWNYQGRVYDRVPRMLAIYGLHEGSSQRPLSTLVLPSWRTYRLSFTAGEHQRGELNGFGVSEQIGSVSIRNVKIFSGGGERWVREFENGMVLLNMTRHPWHYVLPKGPFRRLKGKQTPDINNGEPVGASIVIPAWDASFLVKSRS